MLPVAGSTSTCVVAVPLPSRRARREECACSALETVKSGFFVVTGSVLPLTRMAPVELRARADSGTGW